MKRKIIKFITPIIIFTLAMSCDKDEEKIDTSTELFLAGRWQPVKYRVDNTTGIYYTACEGDAYSNDKYEQVLKILSQTLNLEADKSATLSPFCINGDEITGQWKAVSSERGKLVKISTPTQNISFEILSIGYGDALNKNKIDLTEISSDLIMTFHQY